MTISRLHHTGLTVSDMDASLRFYVGILGFDVVARRAIDQPWLAQLIGVDAAVVDAVDLAIPGSDQVIQLFRFSAPTMASIVPVMAAPGSAHIAFIVEGLRDLLDRFAAAGVPPLAPPVVITSGANAGGTLVCVYDPDGIVVELFEAPIARTA
jgi:catechol 2,3-dioxygenase-like lactoylglutathione lyase family enzyme